MGEWRGYASHDSGRTGGNRNALGASNSNQDARKGSKAAQNVSAHVWSQRKKENSLSTRDLKPDETGGEAVVPGHFQTYPERYEGERIKSHEAIWTS